MKRAVYNILQLKRIKVIAKSAQESKTETVLNDNMEGQADRIYVTELEQHCI